MAYAGAEISLNEKEAQFCGFLEEYRAHVAQNFPSEPQVECRIAGGWVRDKLLNLPSHDIDIALAHHYGHPFAEKFNEFLVKHHPEIQLGHLAKIGSNPEQSKHLETATQVILGLDIDYVNLRQETYTDGNRIPSGMEFGTPLEDALRRDITINSLFYNVHSKKIEDHTGKGLQDLGNGLVRTPLPSTTTFTDDPLRILRCLRFASRYGFTIDHEIRDTVQLPEIKAGLRDRVSRERVGIEVEKMLSEKNVEKGVKSVEWMVDLNLMEEIFSLPEKDKSKVEGEKGASSSSKACAQIIARFAAATHDDALHPVLLEDLDVTWRKTMLLASCVFPYRHLIVKLKKPIQAVELMIRDAVKLNNNETKAVLQLFQAASALSLPTITSFSPSSPRSLIGNILRQPFIHQATVNAAQVSWKNSLLWALICEVETMWDTTAGTWRPNSNVSQVIKSYNKFADIVINMDLIRAIEAPPLMNGVDIQKCLGIKAGKWIRPMIDAVVTWSLDHPGGSIEQCQAWLKEAHAAGQFQIKIALLAPSIMIVVDLLRCNRQARGFQFLPEQDSPQAAPLDSSLVQAGCLRPTMDPSSSSSKSVDGAAAAPIESQTPSLPESSGTAPPLSAPQDGSGFGKVLEGEALVPKIGKVRCYWALMTADLRFLYLDPVLQHHTKEEHDKLLGTSVFDYIHPEELEQAKVDLRGITDSGTLFGSVTRIRYARLMRIRKILGCAEPEYPADKFQFSTDEDYIAIDLVLNWCSEGMLLAFFHAIEDKNPSSDNREDQKSDWTNWCGTPFITQNMINLLWDQVSQIPLEPVPMGLSYPPNRIFQVLLASSPHDILLSHPPPRQMAENQDPSIPQMDGKYWAEDFQKLLKELSLNPLNGSQFSDAKTSCTRRFRTKHTLYTEGCARTIEGVFIPYGTLIFACFQTTMLTPLNTYNHQPHLQHPQLQHNPYGLSQALPDPHSQIPYGYPTYNHIPPFQNQHEYEAQRQASLWHQNQNQSPMQYNNAAHYGDDGNLWHQHQQHAQPPMPSPHNHSPHLHSPQFPDHNLLAQPYHHQHPPPPSQQQHQPQQLSPHQHQQQLQHRRLHHHDPQQDHHHPQEAAPQSHDSLGVSDNHSHSHPSVQIAVSPSLPSAPRLSDVTVPQQPLPPPPPPTQDPAQRAASKLPPAKKQKTDTLESKIPAEKRERAREIRNGGKPPAGVDRCASCGLLESPEWRKGSSGLKDLCNACGLRYARAVAKKEGRTKPRKKADAASSSTDKKSSKKKQSVSESSSTTPTKEASSSAAPGGDDQFQNGQESYGYGPYGDYYDTNSLGAFHSGNQSYYGSPTNGNAG